MTTTKFKDRKILLGNSVWWVSCVAVLLVALMVLPASATLFDLSFAGQVDVSGATVGGVPAAIGSPFTLDIVVDDTNAAIGSYAIQGISYTTTVGTYNTISSWVQPLQASTVGPSIDLSNGGFEINATTEQFLLNLTNFGPSLFNDPLSWTGASITGDIIVRGLGGFGSPDQLSGIEPFTGTLSVSVAGVPEASTLTLAAFGLTLFALRRKRNAA